MVKKIKKTLQEPSGSEEQSPDPEKGNGYWETHKKKKGTLFDVSFFYDWCKACGLCASLCPRKIILNDPLGRPYIEDMDRCSGCRFCVIHCPDFAITVKERFADRRRSTDEE
ncbi:MAG: 4Fe-4S binding protein [Desulfobulbaceae bacterium]|uniref:4Fe-4S binding protein n=1 Tax=Candidatus Desulfatifera sulfidica TaxID=2841691 RepID=A0A8J6TDD5_9BACT|nr:4Fe-4S binding protein [Candidatus Desulfatifera sulfidica]